MKVYYSPRKTPNVSATILAIFSEVDFKEQLSLLMYLPEDVYMCGRNMCVIHFHKLICIC
jgi:hypothetical protein